MKEYEKTVKKILEFLDGREVTHPKHPELTYKEFFEKIDKNVYLSVINKLLTYDEYREPIKFIQGVCNNYKDPKPEETIRISPFGIKHLEILRRKEFEEEEKEIKRERQKINKSIKNIQRYNMGVMIAILMVTAVIGYSQYQIFEETYIPNKANLEINAYRVRDEIVPSYSTHKILNGEGGKLQIHIVNNGRLPSGVVNLNGFFDSKDSESEWAYMNFHNENADYFKNIQAGEGITTEIYIASDNEKKMILGEQEILLQYECSFCKPVLNNFQSTICIHEDYDRDCKK